MMRYITRHGQISQDAEYLGDFTYPKDDKPLSPLGREQARMLGLRLKKLGFSGVILSSPFRRALETATIIAEQVGVCVTPFKGVHEWFGSERAVQSTDWLSIDEIKAQYQHVNPDAELEYPWWPKEVEPIEQCHERVFEAVDLAEKLYPNEEILFVGHGASVYALIKKYGIKIQEGRTMFNCSLSCIDPDDENAISIFADNEHLSEDQITNNKQTKKEWEQERAKQK